MDSLDLQEAPESLPTHVERAWPVRCCCLPTRDHVLPRTFCCPDGNFWDPMVKANKDALGLGLEEMKGTEAPPTLSRSGLGVPTVVVGAS